LHSPFDLLDGDTVFRSLMSYADEFLDPATGFIGYTTVASGADRSKVLPAFSKKKGSPKRRPLPYSTGLGGDRHYPNEKYLHRVPILMSGYNQFSGLIKDSFIGEPLGYRSIQLADLLEHWKFQKDYIPQSFRFILISVLNENWGMLSTTFPDRTKRWGRVTYEKFRTLKSFLDDPRLLMLVVNQHTNISHPKILNLPRGLPSAEGFTSHSYRIIHDVMRRVMKTGIKKGAIGSDLFIRFSLQLPILYCRRATWNSSSFVCCAVYCLCHQPPSNFFKHVTFAIVCNFSIFSHPSVALNSQCTLQTS
jgi:hypothetical protein